MLGLDVDGVDADDAIADIGRVEGRDALDTANVVGPATTETMGLCSTSACLARHARQVCEFAADRARRAVTPLRAIVR